jgi:hypothetical protein
VAATLSPSAGREVIARDKLWQQPIIVDRIFNHPDVRLSEDHMID